MLRKISKIYFFFSVFAFLVFYNSISSAESGVNFKLLPVTIKLGGQVRDVTTQEIIVEFKR